MFVVQYRLLCALLVILIPVTHAMAEDWPQWRGAHRDGVWRETGIVTQFDSDQIQARWRQPIGAGYSGPTVADGRVFVTDRLVEPEQVERVHCFDAKSGTKLWSYSYPCEYTISYTAGPRATVTIEDRRAYALGGMGHLHCLDAGSGVVLWEKDLNAIYSIEADNRMPIWGIAAAPLVHEDLVIIHVGGQDNASMVAFDKKDGEEVWRSLRDHAQYSAPVIIQQAGVPVVVCWTGDSVAGLNPRTGQVYWRHPFAPIKMPIGVATPVVDSDRLFVTSFYDGALMLRLRQDRPEVQQVWRRKGASEKRTDALHSMISTPLIQGDSIFGVDSYGELRCLDATTGDRIWEDQTATPRNRWSNIHLVVNGDRVWMFNERGELIIAHLSRNGFREISRAKLISPTMPQLARRGGVCWAHPAFANRHVFVRNDNELLCASLEQ